MLNVNVESALRSGQYRNGLKTKEELIAFFEFLDDNVYSRKYLGKLYYDPKNPEYGLHNKTWQGYRPVKRGTYKKASQIFTWKGKPISLPTLLERIRRYPQGVRQENKPYNKGAKAPSYTKFEETPTYKLIIHQFKEDTNYFKNIKKHPDKNIKPSFNKRSRHYRTCYLAWMAMGSNIDLLDATIDDWLKVWGERPKEPNQCSQLVRNENTGLIHANHATHLRWAMKNSNHQTVKNATMSDPRFDTRGLKDQVGEHKDAYFTEAQCFLLPKALQTVNTLMFTYFGIIFGGRVSSLQFFTPDSIRQIETKDGTIHIIKFFESKTQEYIDKEITEPELSFITQYLKYSQKGSTDQIFDCSYRVYNRELSKTRQYFAQTEHPLHWTPTSHKACKHTCVSQMSLHGISIDSISDYIGTDAKTLADYYRGGGNEKVREEILGIKPKRKTATWREFVTKLTVAFAERYTELTGIPVTLPNTIEENT